MNNQVKYIVSLTSYPARVGFIPSVYENMKSQSLKPDCMILWLSRDQFPDETLNLPKEVRSLTADSFFQIRFVDGDLKSHKKYYYAMQEFPDDCIITIDDDLVYDEHLLEDLVAGHIANPGAICASRTHLMLTDGKGTLLPYNDWIMQMDLLQGRPSMRLFATTGAGTLFPPAVFGEVAFNREAIEKCCLFGDDLWIKACSLFYDVPVVLVRSLLPLSFIEGSQEESLYSANYEGGNDEQMAKILKYFKNKQGVDLTEKLISSSYDAGLNFDCFERPLAKYKGQLSRAREELASVYASKAFKIGTALASPLRKIRDG